MGTEHNSVRPRPFRFGVVAAGARSGDEWAATARRIESLGYSTILVPDGLNYTLAPFAALAAAAAVTTTLRLGTYVVANDYRHPVMLAKEAATLDFLSGGRLELGIGAGRPAAEADNAMLGLSFDPGPVRVARLGESIALLKQLLAGGSATAAGSSYRAEGAHVSPGPVQQPRPPILVAGRARGLLELAAREADIVAIGIEPKAPAEELARRVEWIREVAGDRLGEIELNLDLVAVGGRVPRFFSERLGLTAESLVAGGAVAALDGDADAMAGRLETIRDRYGISYFAVPDELADIMAPVVERIAGR